MMDRRGVLYAGLAYSAWGLLPAFWKLLSGVPAMETMSHRILWALVFCLIVLTVTRNWDWLRTLRSDGRRLRQLALALYSAEAFWESRRPVNAAPVATG